MRASFSSDQWFKSRGARYARLAALSSRRTSSRNCRLASHLAIGPGLQLADRQRREKRVGLDELLAGAPARCIGAGQQRRRIEIVGAGQHGQGARRAGKCAR